MHLSLRIFYFVSILSTTSSFCSENTSKKALQPSWKRVAFGLTTAGIGLTWSVVITHVENVFCEGRREHSCSINTECAQDASRFLIAAGTTIAAIEGVKLFDILTSPEKVSPKKQ